MGSDVSSGAPVIAISGEVDLSNAAALQSKIDGLIPGDVDRVVLDLSSLAFVDSSGIAVLVRLHNQVGDVEIRNPTPMVRRIVEITGLQGIFGLA